MYHNYECCTIKVLCSYFSQCYAGANNLIPVEIALKIAEKIKADQRFVAYIVIPMWPEGDPKSLAMQRILYWQVFPPLQLVNLVHDNLVM